ncbi:MAG: SBBP repeat-containing protein [Chitinophagales bacterium]
MKKITGLLLLFVFLFLKMVAQPSWKATPRCQTAFVENKGQVTDQHGKRNSDVLFIYANGIFNLQLKQDGFSYELFEVSNTEYMMSEAGIQQEGTHEFTNLVNDHRQLRSHRIDVKFVGADPHAAIAGESASEALFNFYTSAAPLNGITNVAAFNQVKYKNIYPGIDLVFSAPDESAGTLLKYEWILHPGADASKIGLQYNGATALIPTAGEGFRILTGTGRIDESKVIAFRADDKSAVAADYRFHKNTIGYTIARDKANTIIIDPNILWASYYGGELSEDINNGELAVDKQAKVILTGSTFSTLYIATTGAFQTTFSGGYHDAFIAKFSAAGKLSWATYYGASGKDEGHAITTDGDNNILVGGLTTSLNGIATAGSYQTTLAGFQDAFVVKFNSNGIRLWATYFGGSIQDEILDMDCDKNGNLYFTGYTISPDKIATVGAHQETMNNPGGNNGDAFLGEFSPGGSLKWCSYFSGPAQDRAHGICVAKNGALYIEGTAESQIEFATSGVHQSVYGGGGTDAFIAKWDTTGIFFWCSYLGGINEDHGRGVKSDSKGNAYLIGWSASPSGIGSTGSLQEYWFEAYENDGDPKYDGFIAKFHPDGTREWGTYYGGIGKDQMFTLAVDEDKDVVYCGGLTSSTSNIASAGSYQPVYGGSTDGFLAKFSFAGTRLWGTYLGAEDNDELHGLGLDKNGYAYLFLSTEGSTFSATPDAYQTTSNGLVETIITRFNVSDACYDKYEPNNTYSAGSIIKAFDDPNLWGYTAAIASSADADWYKIKLSATTNLKLVLTDLFADYDLKLYKANGQLLFSSANAGTVEETIIYNSAPNGNYLVEIVHTASAFDANNCYRILPITSATPWFMKEGEELLQSSTILQASIYPNPASGKISLKLTSFNPTEVKVTVYNLLHQPVFSKLMDVTETTQELQIPADHLTPGLYVVEILKGDAKTMLKVMLL